MPRVNEEYFENKRKEIIDAAYRVCTKKPITSVAMKDIIAETGFSHGLIYKYYSDFDDLLRDLVIRINQQNKFDDRLDDIMGKATSRNWKSTITQICEMLSEHMIEMGADVIKISLYSDMLAISEPKRVSRIANKIDKNSQSPLFYLVKILDEYMEKVITEKKLHPVMTVDQIIQFTILNYHGIQTGYVLSKSYKAEHLKKKYNPKEMFSCLAQSIISMMGGK